MMTTRETQRLQGGDMDAQLENVLDAYAASEPGPSRATLSEWIRTYPQFARELTQFTAKWQILEWADDAAATDADVASDVVPDDDKLFLHGMSAAQRAFYALRAKRQVTPAREADAVTTSTNSTTSRSADTDSPISSFVTAAKHVGLSFADLRDRVGLSDALLQKLNRRLIDPLTIPARVLADLADTLRQRVNAVAAYVALAPTFAAGAQHRADHAPTLPKTREDFFDAVRSDAALSDARKHELLALPRPQAGTLSPED